MNLVIAEPNSPEVARLVARYAGQLHQRMSGHHVASPLGAWLLLALAADTAVTAETVETPLDPELRAAVEDVLGCSAEVAGAVARQLLTTPPPAVAASAAAWTDAQDLTPALAAAFSSWPAGTATGPIPSQDAADTWAEKATAGLIKSFPVRIRRDTSLLLATALATQIRWDEPFGADEPMPAGSPWSQVGVPLMRAPDEHHVQLWASPHGRLASHRADGGGLSVLSVLAVDSDVSVATLLDYAHHLSAWHAAQELAGYGARGPVGGGLSEVDIDTLFGLPLGEQDLLLVTETEEFTHTAGERRVVCTAALPAWRADTVLPSESLPGLDEGARLLGSRLRSWQQSGPGDVDATQVAMAAFDRYGFKAAAVTAMGLITGAGPQERGLLRQVDVRFARPFVTVAAVDDVSWGEHAGRYQAVPSSWHGLPVFSGGVGEPTSPQPMLDSAQGWGV